MNLEQVTKSTHSDPFVIKQYPKWHPTRLAFTLKARLIEQEARKNYKKYALPEKILPNLPAAHNLDYLNTAVTLSQMQYLLHALSATEHLTNSVIVEVGCYRGVTTRCLASATSRQVIAVDPYIGYGGSEEDYHYFKSNVSGLPNVIHEKVTSGEAARNWKYGSVSFVFIDALHDYVNTAFDIKSWSSLLVKGGILAMHNTERYSFAGKRKAVFDAIHQAELFAHVDNLTLFLFNGEK